MNTSCIPREYTEWKQCWEDDYESVYTALAIFKLCFAFHRTQRTIEVAEGLF